MPHYKDGTEARVGDFVRGKGYNIKDENGELKEIAGTLVGITRDTSACNVRIGVVELVPGSAPQPYGALPSPIDGYWVVARIEYGQADHLEKVG